MLLAAVVAVAGKMMEEPKHWSQGWHLVEEEYLAGEAYLVAAVYTLAEVEQKPEAQ